MKRLNPTGGKIPGNRAARLRDLVAARCGCCGMKGTVAEIRSHLNADLKCPHRVQPTTRPVQELPLPGNCPTCDSPSPGLHPAVQHEGEVQPCKDPWHTAPGPDATGRLRPSMPNVQDPRPGTDRASEWPFDTLPRSQPFEHAAAPGSPRPLDPAFITELLADGWTFEQIERVHASAPGARPIVQPNSAPSAVAVEQQNDFTGAGAAPKTNKCQVGPVSRRVCSNGTSGCELAHGNYGPHTGNRSPEPTAAPALPDVGRLLIPFQLTGISLHVAPDVPADALLKVLEGASLVLHAPAGGGMPVALSSLPISPAVLKVSR